jgi:hypothetical protein
VRMCVCVRMCVRVRVRSRGWLRTPRPLAFPHLCIFHLCCHKISNLCPVGSMRGKKDKKSHECLMELLLPSSR